MMGANGAERARGEDTRDRILEAAREMFVEHGYEATTMRAIAKRVGHTPTAIYHHFRSKEALFAELASEDFRSLAGAFRRIGGVEDPLERLVRTSATYVEFGLTHPMHYQLMFMTPGLPGGREERENVRDPGENAYAFLRHTCAELIGAGRVRPEIDDPDRMAQMLWGTVHGLVSLHIARAGADWIEWRDARRTARHACRAILRGLLRDPGEVDAL